MPTFSERLKLLIKENNCKYTSIEEATGIKHYTISAYINGTSEPDVDSIVKLSNYFKVSSDYLIGYSDQIYPKEINEIYEKLKEFIIEDINAFRDEMKRVKDLNNSSSYYITKAK